MTAALAPVQLARPANVSQTTFIEQSRVAAEVAARVMVAQQNPRNVARSVGGMEQACRLQLLAERAFYRYPRGGQNVTGPTIHLARELARVWTNMDYGIGELSRDDDAGVSEMVAWAWDMETNTRSSMTFQVPHRRDVGQGKDKRQEKLIELRDVYENNTNQGARRLRQCIWSLLPAWFTEQAKALCYETLKGGDKAEPLPARVAKAISRYAGTYNVTADQLEQKTGRVSNDWTEHDLATLHVIFLSLQRGESVLTEEFPPPRVTAEEITAQATAGPSGQARPDDPPRATPEPAATPEAEQAARRLTRGSRGAKPQQQQEPDGWPDTPRPPDAEPAAGGTP